MTQTEHDIISHVWQGIRSYDPRKTFSTWVYTIASRLCIDRLRRARRIVAFVVTILVILLAIGSLIYKRNSSGK